MLPFSFGSDGVPRVNCPDHTCTGGVMARWNIEGRGRGRGRGPPPRWRPDSCGLLLLCLCPASERLIMWSETWTLSQLHSGGNADAGSEESGVVPISPGSIMFHVRMGCTCTVGFTLGVKLCGAPAGACWTSISWTVPRLHPASQRVSGILRCSLKMC